MALTKIKTGGLTDNSVTDAKVADAITITGAQTGITQVGTLTAGVWNGTKVASAYLDDDTAHLSGSAFTGTISSSTSSTTDSALTLTDAGVADYKFTFPDTSTIRLSTSTSSDKILDITNAGSGAFGLRVEGEFEVKNGASRRISLNYEDSVNSIISHSGTSYGLEELNVRGDAIRFYTDYDSGTPKGNVTLTLDNSHNATFAGNIVGKTNSSITYSAGDATTTATGGALNVPGSDIVTGRLFLQGSSNSGTDLIGFNNETNQLALYNYTDGAYIMKFQHDGNVIFTGDISVGGNTLNTWNSLHSAVQLGYGALAVRQNNNTTYLTNNLYYEASGSANPTYMHENEASALMCSDGNMLFFNAPSGTGTATLTERLRVDTEGNVGIGSGSNTNSHIVRGFSANKGLVIETQQPAIQLVDSDNNGRYFTMAYEQSAKTVYMHNQSNGPFRFDTNGTARMSITGDGHLIPETDNAYDLGSSSKGWRNIYTNDLNLSNMKSDGNDVDGTKGSWTIQEGEDDLFLINRTNGKKYKFKLEMV